MPTNTEEVYCGIDNPTSTKRTSKWVEMSFTCLRVATFSSDRGFLVLGGMCTIFTLGCPDKRVTDFLLLNILLKSFFETIYLLFKADAAVNQPPNPKASLIILGDPWPLRSAVN